MTYAGVWYFLKRNDFTLLVPRPMPYNANPIEREIFYEYLAQLLPTLQQDDVLLFQDESGFCQNGIPKRKWCRKGHRSIFKTTGSRKRINVSGAIDPLHDKGHFAISKKHMNSPLFIRFLQHIIETNVHARHIFMIVDNHPAHKSKEVYAYLNQDEIALKLTLLYLPRASPDFNPIEKLWHLLKQVVNYNHFYETFADFQVTLIRNIRKFKASSGRLPSLWQKRPVIDALSVI